MNLYCCQKCGHIQEAAEKPEKCELCTCKCLRQGICIIPSITCE